MTGPKRILITGGTGFIGSRLAMRATAHGRDVRVFGLTNTPAEEENRRILEEKGIEVEFGSITEPGTLRRALRNRDLVFHLAAAQHEMDVPDRHFEEVNVDGTRLLLDLAEEAGVGRVVHGSTIGVYGDPAGVVDEESPSRPVNVYGRTKLEGERAAMSHEGDVSVVGIRIPEVYGPGDRRLLKLFRALDRGHFFMIGSGENFHHPIYVDDLIEGLRVAACASGVDGDVFLLAGKDAVTTDEMVSAVAEAVGRPPPRLRLPMAPFLAAAVVLEATLRPLGVQPPLHRRRLDFFRKSFRLSGKKAERLLGFSPETSFREGARLTAEWYREEGML